MVAQQNRSQAADLPKAGVPMLSTWTGWTNELLSQPQNTSKIYTDSQAKKIKVCLTTRYLKQKNPSPIKPHKYISNV